MRVELMTPSLPRMYSTTELQRLIFLLDKERLPYRRNKVRKNTFFFDSTPPIVIFFIFIVTY